MIQVYLHNVVCKHVCNYVVLFHQLLFKLSMHHAEHLTTHVQCESSATREYIGHLQMISTQLQLMQLKLSQQALPVFSRQIDVLPVQ